MKKITRALGVVSLTLMIGFSAASCAITPLVVGPASAGVAENKGATVSPEAVKAAVDSLYADVRSETAAYKAKPGSKASGAAIVDEFNATYAASLSHLDQSVLDEEQRQTIVVNLSINSMSRPDAVFTVDAKHIVVSGGTATVPGAAVSETQSGTSESAKWANTPDLTLKSVNGKLLVTAFSGS